MIEYRDPTEPFDIDPEASIETSDHMELIADLIPEAMRDWQVDDGKDLDQMYPRPRRLSTWYRIDDCAFGCLWMPYENAARLSHTWVHSEAPTMKLKRRLAERRIRDAKDRKAVKKIGVYAFNPEYFVEEHGFEEGKSYDGIETQYVSKELSSSD